MNNIDVISGIVPNCPQTKIDRLAIYSPPTVAARMKSEFGYVPGTVLRRRESGWELSYPNGVAHTLTEEEVRLLGLWASSANERWTQTVRPTLLKHHISNTHASSSFKNNFSSIVAVSSDTTAIIRHTLAIAMIVFPCLAYPLLGQHLFLFGGILGAITGTLIMYKGICSLKAAKEQDNPDAMLSASMFFCIGASYLILSIGICTGNSRLMSTAGFIFAGFLIADAPVNYRLAHAMKRTLEEKKDATEWLKWFYEEHSLIGKTGAEQEKILSKLRTSMGSAATQLLMEQTTLPKSSKKQRKLVQEAKKGIEQKAFESSLLVLIACFTIPGLVLGLKTHGVYLVVLERILWILSNICWLYLDSRSLAPLIKEKLEYTPLQDSLFPSKHSKPL